MKNQSQVGCWGIASFLTCPLCIPPFSRQLSRRGSRGTEHRGCPAAIKTSVRTGRHCERCSLSRAAPARTAQAEPAQGAALLLSKEEPRIQTMLQGPALLRAHYNILMKRNRDISISQFPFPIYCRFLSGDSEITPQIYRCTQAIINNFSCILQPRVEVCICMGYC